MLFATAQMQAHGQNDNRIALRKLTGEVSNASIMATLGKTLEGGIENWERRKSNEKIKESERKRNRENLN